MEIKKIILAALIVTLSSCGIFKKKCHCPKFSYKKYPTKDIVKHSQKNELSVTGNLKKMN
jgi:hypothetical protein